MIKRRYVKIQKEKTADVQKDNYAKNTPQQCEYT